MKLNFVIVGTMIEFSMEVPNIEFTVPTKMTYQGNEYKVKLYSNNEYESLFHLYLIPNNNDEQLKLVLQNIKKIEDNCNSKQEKHQFDFKYMKGGVETNTQSNKEYLQMKLARHIELEEYELAAIVRDKLRQLSHK